jgi:hypothetical protein
MILLNMRVTPEEHDLVRDIKDLQYGEIYDATIPESGGQPTIELKVTRQMRDLLELIRNGTRFFHRIQVHQSEPQYVEVPGETRFSKFKCLKRYKFV